MVVVDVDVVVVCTVSIDRSPFTTFGCLRELKMF
jgi:hypothetical protein